ncbi:hypothetical protein HQ560_18170, partial [bacterium]|nr:hypothetical protein [bacterium]
MTSDVRRRTAIVSSSLFLVLCVLPLACAPKAPDAKETGVAALPEPRETHFEKSEFVIDDKTILLVTSQATEWTRRAALAIQHEVRERYGHDLPLVRIMDQPKMEPRKAIWLVEPRLVRPPDKTIGVRGLNVDEAMFHDSYFIRTDYMEVVIHGTDAAGTWYGAQAFLQLIRPPAPGSLFRKARPITVPRLWIKDFPKDRVRPIPEA